VEILVINCGSSSLKYAAFDTDTREVLTRGLLERVGSSNATIKRDGVVTSISAPDHATGFAEVARIEDFSRVAAVGHRVVHGGETFTHPTVLNDEVMTKLEEMSPLAPLHNPANILGIRAATAALPGRPQVGVFDTGFHATLPPRAYLYAIPRDLYERDRVRRYGFHGTSHEFVAHEAATALGRPIESLKIVTLHLGNGASACAVDGGISVDTSMGFTPLEGLVMGTRSGDVDPGLVLELARKNGVEATNEMLNRRSGMLGLAGASDLRDVWAASDGGDLWARRALEVFAYRAKKTVGAYAAAMGGLDAIVFTAGIGENDAPLRALILEGLDFLGVRFDSDANAGGGPRLTEEGSPVAALVVRTDEEWAIAKATRDLLA
jgi:acetate kinase